MRKIALLGLSSALALALLSLPAVAAESPTCDDGPVTNTRIQIDGNWFNRPDARIDGLPTSAGSGPFQVAADIEPEVASMLLWYAIAGEPAVGSEAKHDVPMSIDGSTARGTIPRLEMPGYGFHALLFYLEAFNEDGDTIWIDEIPYTCDPYVIGDPYHVILLAPPFDGKWTAVAPDTGSLRIIGKKSVDAATGSTFDFKVIRTGKKTGNSTRGPVMATDWNRDDLVMPFGGFTYDYDTGLLHEWDGATYIRKGS